MYISGAQAILESLLKEGVNTVFGYPGGAVVPLYDALYDYQKKLRHILVRHEQGAVHAAEGYARASGKVGVCFTTSGPGATNLVTGIADAMMDSTPLVCVTGQVAASLVGTDAFQETNIIAITKPITKWNYQIRKAEEIPYVFSQAFSIASYARPGPVLIDITKNAQMELLDFTYDKTHIKHDFTPSLEKIELAALYLNTAQKPLILSGHGVLISNAIPQLITIAEKAEIPVACTLHGLSSLPTDHPLYAGMLGMHGNYAVNMLLNQADVILALGMRFDDRVTGRLKDFAKKAKIIHIDISQKELNKLVKVNLAVLSDLKTALKELLKFLKNNKHSSWIHEFHKLRQIEEDHVFSQKISLNNKKITMTEVVRLISKKTHGKAFIVSDVGQHQMVTAQSYSFRQTRSFITSGGLGTLGFALAASIGVKIAKPEQEVVVIVGDGGFQMTIQELATIAQEKLPVKIVILNNNYLGMVRQWQELFFKKRYSFTALKNPDFIKIAAGFSIKAQRVIAKKDLDKGIEKLLKSKGAYLLEIMVQPEENVFPMVPAGAAVDEVRLK